jgi:hypothetical protein
MAIPAKIGAMERAGLISQLCEFIRPLKNT